MEAREEPVTCPACGGAGGGPFGRAGSAWDDEEFVCTLCKGLGVIALDDVMIRPGLVKAQVPAAAAVAPKKRSAG